MISNAFLMYVGLSADDAYAKIREARAKTALEVGVGRLYFGEQFVRIYGTRDSLNPDDLMGVQLEMYKREISQTAQKGKEQRNNNANKKRKDNRADNVDTEDS